jgi:uncharacterized iron-regulated membrane protein
MNKIEIQDHAKRLRIHRKLHRISASFLFVFFIFMATTGAFLGWKKHSGGILLKENKIGTTSQLDQWLSLDSMQNIALKVFQEEKHSRGLIDRMEIVPKNGIVKFTFLNSYLGLQIDGASGRILVQETRRADFLEQVHDGSIIDRFFKWSNGTFKVIYTSLMGVGLLLFSITGYWLWAGPRRIRRKMEN